MDSALSNAEKKRPEEKRRTDIIYVKLRSIFEKTLLKGVDKEEVDEFMTFHNTAYELAKLKHRFDERKDKRPYKTHLGGVRDILMTELPDLNMEKVLLAYLHDIVEDGHLRIETIEDIFGEEIAEGVALLSKKPLYMYLKEDDLSTYTLLSPQEKKNFISLRKRELKEARNADYFPTLFNSNNNNAIWVKIADRLHNLRDMTSLPPETIQRKIIETEQYFYPGLEQYGETYTIGLDKIRSQIGFLKRHLMQIGYAKSLSSTLKK